MATLNTPVSVAEVAEQAGNYTYNVHIPLANWLRTANTMQKESTRQKAMMRRRTFSYIAMPTLSFRSCKHTQTGTSPRTARRSTLPRPPSVAT
ncbi:hypothetical protein P3342_012037 [Pyrenophora teres f. teres]|nr:hypothetical protein P3342_012037 [Pyrenophora teres f. teres]